jgi:hypothetical protein
MGMSLGIMLDNVLSGNSHIIIHNTCSAPIINHRPLSLEVGLTPITLFFDTYSPRPLRIDNLLHNTICGSTIPRSSP